MTHSTELSEAAKRRLDELCDEWAAWYCDRWVDRPGVEVTSAYRLVPDSRRIWLSEDQITDDYLRDAAETVDRAVDMLPREHMAVLHAWAWENHYNRGLIRKVKKTETGVRVTHSVFKSKHAEVTEASLTAAQVALMRVLGALHIEVG